MDEDKEGLRARDYAYRLLSYRQRSIREIRQRLEKKGFDSKAINKTVEYLSQLNYLNDKDFAKFWIQARLESGSAGRLLVRCQLKQKGLSKEIIEQALGEYAGGYDENEAAKRLAAVRSRRYKGLEPVKLKRRLYGYLRRRGFSQDAISQAIATTD